RRSDIFSTSENNQNTVEVHVAQGEREMAADNKSLGRFKLYGIPPAPRGIPQIQVSFDIDANGILQVTALDRTTGREQSITVQGASNLSEADIQQAIRDAEKFADVDRQRKEKVEKRTRSEALILQAERQLREVALDFGMQFARNRRQRIDNICRDLKDSLKADDDRGIDQTYADLQDALSDLNKEVRQYYADDEEDDLFGTIRDIFIGDKDDDDFYDKGYGRGADRGYGRDAGLGYGNRDYDRGYGKDYDRGAYGRDADRGYGREPDDRGYGRDADRGYGREPERGYARNDRGRDKRDSDRGYGRDNSYPNYDKDYSPRKPAKPSYQDNWDDDDDDWL
ncbi:MAG: Hsp70 family protein, partial [Rivularia sp. (in: cyanobacteria)]